MTAQTRTKVVDLLMSAIIGLAATLFVLFGTGAWSSKENAIDHDRDIRAVIQLQQRTLDAVCDAQPKRSRACQAAEPVVGQRTP